MRFGLPTDTYKHFALLVIWTFFISNPEYPRICKNKIWKDNVVDTENDGINAFISQKKPAKKQPLPDKAKGKIRETLRWTTRNVPVGKNKEYEEDELLSRETKNCSMLTEETLEAFLLLVGAFQWSFVTCGVFIKFRALYISMSPHSASFRQEIQLTLILRRSRTGTVWFYTSTSKKRAARPKLYTKSLTRDLKLMYSRLTLVRISIKL